MMHHVLEAQAAETSAVPSGDVDPLSIGHFIHSLGGELYEIALTLTPHPALLYCFTVDQRPLRVRVPLYKERPVQSLAAVFPVAATLERHIAAQDAALTFV